MTDCKEYRPDANGECLNCDEPLSEHSTEAHITGLETELRLRQNEIVDLVKRLRELQQQVDAPRLRVEEAKP